MRYLWLLAGLAILLAGAACGGDDTPDVPAELADVCTQGDNAATDTIDIKTPAAGAEVSSPLAVNATLTIEDPIIYLSIVGADGVHITDYPGHLNQTGEDVSFQQNVPFGVEEETPACLWVSHTNQADPPEAVRIPITLLPGGTR